MHDVLLRHTYATIFGPHIRLALARTLYDLSNGFARLMSQGLLGKHIDGVWHTSVVVNGAEEVYFGQGIQRAVPGTTPHGQPLQIISLGCAAAYLGRGGFFFGPC